MTAAEPFRVVDDGGQRADLAQRSETKFVFHRHDVATLRSALLRAGTPIRHAGTVSTVRSIYFDDLRLGACRANLDGHGVRKKTRIRWYDRPLPTDEFFLEVKWRRHLATGKHRWCLSGGEQLTGLPLADVPGHLASVLPERFGAVLTRAMQAVVLVEYRREHFALADARLTLDYDLRFVPLLGRRRLGRGFAARLPGTALIECKTALGAPQPLASMFRSLLARPARFSKYVTGCMQLGYVTAS